MKIFKAILSSILMFCLVNIFAWAESEEQKTTDAVISSQNFETAKSQLRRLGVTPKAVDLKKKDISIWSSCSDGIWGEGDPERLMVRFTTAAPMTINKIEIEKGSDIQLCDGKLSNLFQSGKNLIQGYLCQGSVHFDENERLCYCTLGRDTKIEGVLISANMELHLYKGKPYAVLLSPKKNSGHADAVQGYYKFEKGKLEYQKGWDSLNICQDFIKTK